MLYHIINTAKQLNPKRIIIVISQGMKGHEKEIKKISKIKILHPKKTTWYSECPSFSEKVLQK